MLIYLLLDLYTFEVIEIDSSASHIALLSLQIASNQNFMGLYFVILIPNLQFVVCKLNYIVFKPKVSLKLTF